MTHAWTFGLGQGSGIFVDMDIQGSWAYHSSMHRRRGDIVHHLTRRGKKKRSQHDSNARHLRARSPSLPAARIFPAHLATENAPLERTVHRAAGDLENRFFFFVTDASPDHNQCGVLSRRTDRSSQSIHLAVRFHVAGERRRSFFPDAV